jgi:hypothetical protein
LLSDNEIGDNVIETITPLFCLKYNKSLRAIHIASIFFNQIQFRTYFLVADNKIGPEGMRRLSEALKNTKIREINLSGSSASSVPSPRLLTHF